MELTTKTGNRRVKNSVYLPFVDNCIRLHVMLTITYMELAMSNRMVIPPPIPSKILNASPPYTMLFNEVGIENTIVTLNGIADSVNNVHCKA